MTDLPNTEANRHRFGKILDSICKLTRGSDMGAPLARAADEAIKQYLPELFKKETNTLGLLKEYRIKKDASETFSREVIQVYDADTMNSLGKISSIRWESYAFVKGGAGKGVNYGSLSDSCHEQVKKVEDLAASVLGSDAGVLAPGFYSKDGLHIKN